MKTRECPGRVFSLLVPLVSLLALLLVAAPVSAGRIVAVGDVHGSFSGLRTILRATELIDQNDDWIGGDTTFVQTGDLLDRGTELKEVVGLLQKLQKQAPQHGGEVVVLMGNHEAMNILGVMRDVAVEAYESFVDENSEKRREESYKDYMKWARQRAKRLGEGRPNFDSRFKKQWLEHVPLGQLEYLDALAPDGELGKWLRSLPTVAQRGGAVFLHGGIPPALGSWSTERINERVRQEIRDLDECRKVLLRFDVIHETASPSQAIDLGLAELRSIAERVPKTPEPMRTQLTERGRILRDCMNYQDWFLVKEDGPLWFRGFARWSDEEGAALIQPLLDARQAKHFVVGHTVQPEGRIRSRFDGRIFLIDTGMLASVYIGGRPSALELVNGRARAIYEEEEEVLWQAAEEAAAARLPPGPARSVETILRSAVAGRAGLLASLQLLLAMPTPVVPAPADDSVFGADRRLRGPDNEPLPFTEEEEVLEFLREARIVKAKRIKQGINQPFKLMLEKDGVQAHAVFRSVDAKEERFRLDDRFYTVFRDSYIHELAAYELSRLLGLDAVPPVVLRRFRGDDGSIQIWIENAVDEKTRLDEEIDPPGLWWAKQKIVCRVFDALIANHDRNAGNILVDRDRWTVWLIDHTRSFFETEELEAEEMLSQIERGLWERLNTVDRELVTERLDPYLTDNQLHFLFVRWDRLLEHYREEIASRGEDSVLFSS